MGLRGEGGWGAGGEASFEQGLGDGAGGRGGKAARTAAAASNGFEGGLSL